MVSTVLDMTISARIKRCRESLGLSQNELARRANILHPTLQKIEAGKSTDPQISTLSKIAFALGVPVTDLIGADYEQVPYKQKPEDQEQEASPLEQRLATIEASMRTLTSRGSTVPDSDLTKRMDDLGALVARMNGRLSQLESQSTIEVERQKRFRTDLVELLTLWNESRTDDQSQHRAQDLIASFEADA